MLKNLSLYLDLSLYFLAIINIFQHDFDMSATRFTHEKISFIRKKTEKINPVNNLKITNNNLFTT